MIEVPQATLHVAGDLRVEHDAQMNSQLTVNGPSTHGSLICRGNLNVTGAATLTNATCSKNLTVSGMLKPARANVGNAGLSVSGPTALRDVHVGMHNKEGAQIFLVSKTTDLAHGINVRQRGNSAGLYIIQESVGQCVYAHKTHNGGRAPIEAFGQDAGGFSIISEKKIVAAGIAVGSDARVKNDLEAIDRERALRNVLALKPSEYSYEPAYMDSSSGRQRGFVAQEVREVLPNAVASAGDRRLSNGETISEFLTIDGQQLLAEAVAAIQALHERVETLEAQLAIVSAEGVTR